MIGNWYKYGIRASISIEKNLEIFSFFESLGYDRGNLKGKAAGYEIYAIGDDNRIHCITSVSCNIIFETLEDTKNFLIILKFILCQKNIMLFVLEKILKMQ